MSERKGKAPSPRAKKEDKEKEREVEAEIKELTTKNQDERSGGNLGGNSGGNKDKKSGHKTKDDAFRALAKRMFVDTQKG